MNIHYVLSFYDFQKTLTKLGFETLFLQKETLVLKVFVFSPHGWRLHQCIDTSHITILTTYNNLSIAHALLLSLTEERVCDSRRVTLSPVVGVV